MKPHLKEIFNSRILLSPLNWGFGHVSRCIPIIQQLINQGNYLIICCNKNQADIFEDYLENKKKSFEIVIFEGYPFAFNGKGNFKTDLLKRSFQLLKFYHFEKKWVDEKVKKLKIDFVISDHRYGFQSKKCHSIFITHQYNIPSTFIANKIHHCFFSKFETVWIVDDENKNLAGNLSNHFQDERAINIGTKSRFEIYQDRGEKTRSVLILNGPEKYWQALLDFFKEKLIAGEIDTLVLSDNSKVIVPKEFCGTVISNKSWIEMDQLLLQAKKVYGYMGYSTLMDLLELQISFENLIPCKGQSEQQYLYKLHKTKKSQP